MSEKTEACRSSAQDSRKSLQKIAIDALALTRKDKIRLDPLDADK